MSINLGWRSIQTPIIWCFLFRKNRGTRLGPIPINRRMRVYWAMFLDWWAAVGFKVEVCLKVKGWTYGSKGNCKKRACLLFRGSYQLMWPPGISKIGDKSSMKSWNGWFVTDLPCFSFVPWCVAAVSAEPQDASKKSLLLVKPKSTVFVRLHHPFFGTKDLKLWVCLLYANVFVKAPYVCNRMSQHRNCRRSRMIADEIPVFVGWTTISCYLLLKVPSIFFPRQNLLLLESKTDPCFLGALPKDFWLNETFKFKSQTCCLTTKLLSKPQAKIPDVLLKIP